MKAIILSAGQGKRLLPFTESLPKCLLPVDGERPAIEVQLRALVACGVTEARVAVVHGQMTDHAIEQRMLDFVEHRADVLVATTIVESGLDIPNANTLIVDRADAIGLADLHQLRGRVGRGRHRAHAIFMLHQ